MASYPALGRLNEIAEDQWGLVTRRQALNAGVGQTTIDRLTADGSVMRRVAHGVYRMVGAPEPDHLQLRAAWLQLAPGTMGWERGSSDGVVSHRSAADMYGLGHLPEDRHDFTVGRRRQSRRGDVRIHQRHLGPEEWIVLRGLPVTRPARIASDLLYDREDPAAVAHVVRDALRGENASPGFVVDALAPHAARFGLRKGDGLALLKWMLDLVGDPATPRWLSEARAQIHRNAATSGAPEGLAVESAA
ncbi:MAG: type IV toxin-antitoxin system AbiEi family antitoxin domain-containing protein [Solirubrobacteraceae bacterium]